MTRKLFLTSEGLPPETAPDFLKLLGRDPEGMKVAFIPTAGYPEINPVHLNEVKKGLGGFGFKVEVIDLKKEEPGNIRDKLEETDIICVGGGNTFFLLDWVRKTGLDKYLGELLDRGKIYLSISAGSILVGPDVESSFWCHEPDINVINLKDLTGLNLVPFTVVPHFIEEDLPSLKEKANTVDYPIIALNDTQAVRVTGNDFEIIGSGEKITFNLKRFPGFTS